MMVRNLQLETLYQQDWRTRFKLDEEILRPASKSLLLRTCSSGNLLIFDSVFCRFDCNLVLQVECMCSPHINALFTLYKKELLDQHYE